MGLIGDDIHAVAKWAEKEYGIKCIAFSCEGYKGVSQSAGHHIANNQLMKFVMVKVIVRLKISSPLICSVNITLAETVGKQNVSKENRL